MDFEGYSAYSGKVGVSDGCCASTSFDGSLKRVEKLGPVR